MITLFDDLIPLAEAMKICEKYRLIHSSNVTRQCRNCLGKSNGIERNMKYCKSPKNDGCDIVNQLYKLYINNRKEIYAKS